MTVIFLLLILHVIFNIYKQILGIPLLIPVKVASRNSEEFHITLWIYQQSVDTEFLLLL